MKKWIVAALLLCMFSIMLIACGKDTEKNYQQNAEVENTDESDLEKEDTENKDTENKDTKNEEAKNEDTQNEGLKTEIVLDESKATIVMTSANVNFRKQPDTSSEVIKVLSRGTEVKQYEVENDWALVKCADEIGYVHAGYLVDPAKVQEEPQKDTTTTNKVEAIHGQHRNPNSAVVVIDPGHQLNGDSTKEPNGPGSSVMKARVTSGTTGVATGVAEYILNLDISLKLKTELENRGYTVYMTRTTHNVNISNMERAQYASSVGADIAVRIHGNGAASSVRGAETLAPSSENPYVSHLASASYSLSKCIIDQYCAVTGFINRGVKLSDTMTGINWSEVPVTIIELGFMSNPEEDRAMQDATMQNNMVQGIANGIDAYFGF